MVSWVLHLGFHKAAIKTLAGWTGEESTSKLSHIIGRFGFFADVGLRAQLHAGSWLEATVSPGRLPVVPRGHHSSLPHGFP